MSDETEAAQEAVVLRYAAKDDAYLIGVPARDLTADDLKSPELNRFGKTKPTIVKRLVESGLYAEAASEPAVADKSEES